MFSFCSRKFFRIKWSGDLSTFFLLIRNSSLRFSSNATEQSSLTVDYLIKRCGLTQESALKASQRINIKSTTNADWVRALLDSYGLPKSCISKLISNHPAVLSGNPKKILEPKIEYFLNMGMTVPDLAKIFSKDPSILAGASLTNQIIPSMEFLRSFLNDGKNIALVLSRLRWNTGFQRLMEPNIELLRNQGVPEPVISKLVIICPQALTLKQPRFNEAVLKAKEMGFDPSSLMFVHAIRTLSQMNTTLETKLEVFRNFGWSEDEILCMFRKQPYCLTRSEKILRIRLDFFMNKLSLTAAEITTNPVVLLLSMEKRTVPRCSVIQVLLSQGLMKKQSIGSALLMNDARFLENFVRKYHQELPQLLQEYKRNME
ncbi:transcription termination factor 1, mitochondrial-like isoform X2 [Telopea speciosissima]|uniref:transcription termination factor 1, mitochondrial-like isoform X2 n=1 Tax=Telopea speciosissima TaxID=54955 RepID=UPI001CC43428|nr:transcription termination factor 1, mitochondrial-like isoform X2 [Telopea speciosissima]